MEGNHQLQCNLQVIIESNRHLQLWYYKNWVTVDAMILTLISSSSVRNALGFLIDLYVSNITLFVKNW